MSKPKPKAVKNYTSVWAEVVQEARTRFYEMEALAETLADALQAMRETQASYRDFERACPDELENTELGSALASIMALDLDNISNDPLGQWDKLELILNAAEEIKLPYMGAEQ